MTANNKKNNSTSKTEKTKKQKSQNIKISPIKIILFIVILGLVFLSYYVTSSFNYEENLKLDGTFKIPLIDKEINLKESSLALASIIIGFIDGFNPCAMWVLIYLITLVASLEDKRKMFFIVGTFVTTEAIMYFMILAGWLELFRFIGFSKWIMYGVGAFALWFGIYAIYDFIRKGGHITCEVGDMQQKKKTMNKIKDIASSPLTIATVFATIILAIGVNSIEFICSAGLPAIFTQMLAIADVSTFAKYMYILLYDLFFMLDDFIIFGLAIFAINSPLLDKYSGLSKILGGVIMTLIGIMLLFFPNFLM